MYRRERQLDLKLLFLSFSYPYVFICERVFSASGIFHFCRYATRRKSFRAIIRSEPCKFALRTREEGDQAGYILSTWMTWRCLVSLTLVRYRRTASCFRGPACVSACPLAWLTDRSRCHDEVPSPGQFATNRLARRDNGCNWYLRTRPVCDKELGGISERHDVAHYLFLFTRAGRVR